MANLSNDVRYVHLDGDHQSEYTYANFGTAVVLGRPWGVTQTDAKEGVLWRFKKDDTTEKPPKDETKLEVPMDHWQSEDGKYTVRWQRYQVNHGFGRVGGQHTNYVWVNSRKIWMPANVLAACVWVGGPENVPYLRAVCGATLYWAVLGKEEDTYNLDGLAGGMGLTEPFEQNCVAFSSNAIKLVICARTTNVFHYIWTGVSPPAATVTNIKTYVGEPEPLTAVFKVTGSVADYDPFLQELSVAVDEVLLPGNTYTETQTSKRYVVNQMAYAGNDLSILYQEIEFRQQITKTNVSAHAEYYFPKRLYMVQIPQYLKPDGFGGSVLTDYNVDTYFTDEAVEAWNKKYILYGSSNRIENETITTRWKHYKGGAKTTLNVSIRTRTLDALYSEDWSRWLGWPDGTSGISFFNGQIAFKYFNGLTVTNTVSSYKEYLPVFMDCKTSTFVFMEFQNGGQVLSKIHSSDPTYGEGGGEYLGRMLYTESISSRNWPNQLASGAFDFRRHYRKWISQPHGMNITEWLLPAGAPEPPPSQNVLTPPAATKVQTQNLNPVTKGTVIDVHSKGTVYEYSSFQVDESDAANIYGRSTYVSGISLPAAQTSVLPYDLASDLPGLYRPQYVFPFSWMEDQTVELAAAETVVWDGTYPNSRQRLVTLGGSPRGRTAFLSFHAQMGISGYIYQDGVERPIGTSYRISSFHVTFR